MLPLQVVPQPDQQDLDIQIQENANLWAAKERCCIGDEALFGPSMVLNNMPTIRYEFLEMDI